MKTQVLFRPRTRLISLVILSALLLYSCDAFKEDMFPAYLGQEQAQIDGAALKAFAGIDSSAMIGTIAPLSIPSLNTSTIALTLHQFMTPTVLVLLDGKTLNLRKSFTNIPIGKFYFVDIGNYIITGTENEIVWNISLINPLTLAVSILDFNDFAQFGFGAMVNTNEPTNLLVGMVADAIQLQTFKDTWDLQTTYSQSDILSDNTSDSTNFSIQDLYYDGTKVRLLLYHKTSPEAYLFTWETVEAFISSFDNGYLASGATVTQVPRGKGDSGWLCRGGYIIRVDRDGPILERYRLDGGNEKLDQFKLPPNSRSRLAFFKDGSAWIYYDEQQDRLHLMRPWW